MKNKFNWINDYITAFGMEGLVVMGFYLGSLFTSDIRKNEHSWPFLELTGESGSGKTTLLNILAKLVGEHGAHDVLDPEFSTFAARIRVLGSAVDKPVVFTNSGSFDFDRLRELYNGGVWRMANKNSMDVEAVRFKGSVIIESQRPVSGSYALASRITTVELTRVSHTEESRSALKRLMNLSPSEIGDIRENMFLRAVTIKSAYRSFLPVILEIIGEKLTFENPRIVFNHAQLLAITESILSSVFPYAVDLPLSHLGNKLEKYILRCAEEKAQSLIEAVQ